MDGDWSWWMLLGWTWMVLFWGLVVWGAASLFQRSGRDPARSHDNEPLAILERRYARGELARAEFEEMRQTLKSG